MITFIKNWKKALCLVLAVMFVASGFAMAMPTEIEAATAFSSSDVSMESGASIRLYDTTGGNNTPGIRFTASVDKTKADAAADYGIIMTDSESLRGKELTIDNAQRILHKTGSNFKQTEVDGKYVLKMVLTKIKDKNFSRSYVARAFIKDASGNVYYSDVVERSPYAVAAACYENKGDKLNEAALNILKEYMVLDIRVNEDGSIEPARIYKDINDNRITVSGSIDNLSFVGLCQSIIINGKRFEAGTKITVDINGAEYDIESAIIEASKLLVSKIEHSHNYVWDKSHADYDIKACSCGARDAESRFNKVIDADRITIDLTLTSKYLGFNADTIKAQTGLTNLYGSDIDYHIGSLNFATGTHIGNVNLTSDIITELAKLKELHGYTYVDIQVKDDRAGYAGEYHTIKYPVLLITANVATYAEWVEKVYPANGDTYGCYNLTAQINFAGNAELSAPKGAFKGTLVGNNNQLVGSQGYGRHIFGALDGAHIVNVRIQENGYRGSYTRNGLVIGLLGTTMKNTILKDISFELKGCDWASAIDISAGTGWLVGEEASGNTMTNISVIINKSVNALAPIFGSNYSNNTISGFTWTETIAAPEGEIIIGKNSSSTTYLCDANNGGIHTPASTASYDATGHWYLCAVCEAKTGFAAHSGYTNGGDTHSVSCSCGYTSEAAAHSYTWDKSAADKDIGTCVCGTTVEFDKELEGVLRLFEISGSNYFGENILKSTSDVTNVYSYDLVDFTKAITYSIDGTQLVSRTGSFVLQDIEVLKTNLALHGYKNILAVVTDIYGETHEVLVPIRIVTANIGTYAEWVEKVYPANGDTYGCYNLTAGINFAGSAELSAPKGAFKGTIIGNSCELIGSQGYGRHIFGALDGAYIENIIVRENGYRGSYTRNSLVMGLLGTTMKNSTLNNVTFRLQGSDWASAIDISAGTGWLVGGEASGNTMTNITVEIKKTVNALAPLFGSNYSNNTISGFTWKVADGVTVPAGEIIVGKNTDETTYLCDVAYESHTPGAQEYDNKAHWHTCSVCGSMADYAFHSAPTDLGDGTHKLDCSCGYATEAVSHTYTWTIGATEDVGICECGNTLTVKTLINTSRQEVDFDGASSKWAKIENIDAIREQVPEIQDTGNTFFVGGEKQNGDLTGITYTMGKELHGEQYLVIRFTDTTGQSHDVRVPMLFVTKTISSATDWMNYIFPKGDDVYGYYKQASATAINLAGNDYKTDTGLTSYPTATGAFKGTFVGDGTFAITGSRKYGRNLFGNLDGATIVNLVVKENCIDDPSSTERALLGGYMKNTVLENVTIQVTGTEGGSISTEVGNGWFISGEVSNNVIENLTIEVTKTITAIPSLFGANCSGNQFGLITATATGSGISLPSDANIAPAAKTTDGEEFKIQTAADLGFAIVMPKDPSNILAIAANELQVTIKSSTGIHLPVIYSDNTATIAKYNKLIVLGDCTSAFAADSTSKTKLEALLANAKTAANGSIANNAYALGANGTHIFLCGANDRGTMNAVYKFLEIYYNYEAYSVDYVYYNVAEQTELTFDTSLMASYEEGVSAMYLGNSHRGLVSDSREMYRMGFSGDYAVDLLMSIVEGDHNSKTHNSTVWIPYSSDTKKFYRQEKTWIGTYSTKQDDLCYTAHGDASAYQEMLQYCVDVAKKALSYAENADKVILPFSKEDVTAHCECKGCTNLANAHGGNYSATVVQFMNDLMAAIEADPAITRTDFKLMFFAYEDFETAPTGMTLDDRIIVMIPAAYSFDYQQSINHANNAAGKANLKAWYDMSNSGEIFLWTYSTKFSNYLLPTNTFNFYNEETYAYFKECGVTLLANQGQSNQTGNATAWHKLKMYLDGALPNEPGKTQAELIAQYMTETFGPASELMNGYFTSQRDYISNNTTLQNWYAGLDDGAYTILGAFDLSDNSDGKWTQEAINSWLAACNNAYTALEEAKTAGTLTDEDYARIKKNIDAEWVCPAYMSLKIFGNTSVKTQLVTVIQDLGIEKHGEFNKVGGGGSEIDIISHIESLG